MRKVNKYVRTRIFSSLNPTFRNSFEVVITFCVLYVLCNSFWLIEKQNSQNNCSVYFYVCHRFLNDFSLFSTFNISHSFEFVQ